MNAIRNRVSDTIRGTITDRYLPRCFVAITLVFLVTWLSHQYINPLYTLIFPLAREISVIGSVLAFLLISLTASFRPAWIRLVPITVIALFAYATGLLLIYFATRSGDGFLLSLGGLYTNFGASVISVFACVTLIKLSTKKCATCIAFAAIAFYLSKLLFLPFDYMAGIIAYALSSILILVVIFPVTKKVLEEITPSVPPATLSVTEPRSFLPFSHVFFITLLVFNAACGYSVSFNLVDGVPISTLFAAVPVIMVALWMIRSKTVAVDGIYRVSYLLVVSGLLVLLLPQLSSTSLPNTLLAAGVNCFKMLMFFTLAAIGRRNPLNALTLFSWGEFAMNGGILLGSSFGVFTFDIFGEDSSMILLIVVLTIVLFFVYNLFVLRNFSFKDTVQDVDSMPDLEAMGRRQDRENDFIKERSREISQHYNLTERETEIFELLAQGRNVPFIETKLIISHNTVKTHVKHIYQKIDLHSQQELIDLAENFVSVR